MNPKQPDNQNPAQISGEPLDLDILLALAEIGTRDIESAILWFDEHASPEWVGALDAPFYEDVE